MNHNSLVSIVIPIKNEKRKISTIIMGIYKQRYRPIEVIFVDGGSTDGSIELINEYRIKLSSNEFMIRLLKEEDYGPLRSPANARNIGIKNASGDYIILLDADFELVDENIITKIVENLRNNDHVAVTYEPNKHTWIEKHYSLDEIVSLNCKKPVHILCCFKKDVFRKALFDINLGFHEDVDFLQRVGTKYVVIDANVRRCWVHTLKDFARQRIWYGRTAHRYFRKIGMSWVRILFMYSRWNAVNLLLILLIIISFINIPLVIPIILLLFSLITYRWLRRDLKCLGLRAIPERLAWYLFKETIGKIFFDIGVIIGLMSKNVRLGR